MSVKSILIVGVGGQGTLLASKLLGNALVASGRDVKVSEVHGMSQRGGSVITYVRYADNGETVSSPIIEPGEADVILSFELLEAARFLPYLKEGGVVITNTQQIDPMPVVTGQASYPASLDVKMALKFGETGKYSLESLPALELSMKAGSAKAVNVVLLGVLSRHMDISPELWHETIVNGVPEKFRELNLTAFELGRTAGK